MTGEYLTQSQVEALHPNEWVFLDRSSPPKNRQPFSGRVVWHHPDRDEFDARLMEFSHVTQGAIFFTGKPDPNEIWLLNL
jgi:hypothetical protein